MAFSFFVHAAKSRNNSLNNRNSDALLTSLRMHALKRSSNNVAKATRLLKVLNGRYLQGKLSNTQANKLKRIAIQLAN
jgi:hypothetical protein